MKSGEAWQEVDDGVFRRRYQSLDLNIGMVVGAEAVLLIDSRANPREAEELRNELSTLTTLPVGWIFNTHYHWDHTFGNQAFPEAELWGHDMCRTELVEHGSEMLSALFIWLAAELHLAFREVVITPPTETFTNSAVIELGNRRVELEFHGRGHTNSDAVLHVGNVTFAGDLIEEGNPPGVGDSFPLAWVDTLTNLEAACRPTVVPGHGDVVDRGYVAGTRQQLQWLADTARVAFAEKIASEAIDLTGAPYPEEVCREALARAYAELSSSAKFSQ